MSDLSDKNTKKISDNSPETKGQKTDVKPAEPAEKGGPKGPEPTRFGDWESNGRCTDF